MKYFKKEAGALAAAAVVGTGLVGLNMYSKNNYANKVSTKTGIPKQHVKSYMRNLNPTRFMVPSQQFAKDIKPLYDLKEYKYNPLNKGLRATKVGSPEEKVYMKKNKAQMDKLLAQWLQGQNKLYKQYRTQKVNK